MIVSFLHTKFVKAMYSVVLLLFARRDIVFKWAVKHKLNIFGYSQILTIDGSKIGRVYLVARERMR